MDPNTSPSAKRFGAINFLYFRDLIFKGRHFSSYDPFTDHSLADISISQEELLTTVVCTNLENMLVFSEGNSTTITPDLANLAAAPDKNVKLQSVRATIRTMIQRGFVSSPPDSAFISYCNSL
jgi:hypothetical protein